MDMYLTAKNSGERVRIPLLPDRVSVRTGSKTITSSIINIGEVKIPRGSTLAGYSWNGFFPGEHMKDASYIKGWVAPDSIIKTLVAFMEKGTTLVFVITDLGVNEDVFIESFNYEFYGGSGDASYTLTLTRRRALLVTTIPPQPITPPPPVGGEPPPSTNKTGTVSLSNKNSNLNVRQTASTSAKILGTLKHGAKVEIIRKTGNWSEIVYAKGKNGTAYVYASYIKVNTTSTGSSSSGSSSGTKATTSSGTTSSSSYTVKSGDTLYSIAKAKLGNGNRYTEIYSLNKSAIDAKNKGKSVSKYTIYSGMT